MLRKKEKVFRVISVLVLIGLTGYYSYRLIFHYNKFNEIKVNEEKRVATIIRKNNDLVLEGEGLYNIKGEFVFKGKNVNNYLYYSNILWRIIKVNNDNSIKLVTEDIQSSLTYGDEKTTYENSYIRNWLNKSEQNTGIFEGVLNNPQKYLSKTFWCNDKVEDMKIFNCKELNTNDMVSLLGYDDYLNSNSSKGYLNNNNYFWMVNYNENDEIWYINKNGQIANDTVSAGYGVRPVITLSNKIDLVNGDGSKESPYTIEKDAKTQIFGSYYKLGSDIYRAYNVTDNNVKLVLDNYYIVNNTEFKYAFSTTSKRGETAEFNIKNKKGLPYYLNNTFYNSLTYKDSLISCDWYSGTYGSDTNNNYQNIYTESINTKVGLLNIADVILNKSLSNYFIMTSPDKLSDMLYVLHPNSKLYQDVITESKVIRPTICINKSSVSEGNGTINAPFIVR